MVGEHSAIFAEAERVIADPIVRNRGTIGGSLCQADPLRTCRLWCLAGAIVLHSKDGQRTVAGAGIHLGP